MPYDLESFSLIDMLQCGRAIRRAAESATSLDDAAEAIVAYLYAELESASVTVRRPALVRFYKTKPYSALDERLRARSAAQSPMIKLRPETRCLTLLATIGDQPEWCDPRQSVGHQAIPLPSASIVEQAPMIAQLIREMGMEIRDVVDPDPSLISEREGRTYNVFHVEDALGSAYIPAQDEFVIPYGIGSVIGFGGMLSDGDMFAVIVFARGRVPAHAAARFRNIALDVKAIVHPFVRPALTSP
jgi:hypothetical protein